MKYDYEKVTSIIFCFGCYPIHRDSTDSNGAEAQTKQADYDDFTEKEADHNDTGHN